MLGGGNWTQTYAWMEKYDPCNPFDYLGFLFREDKKMEPWTSYHHDTERIVEWDEPY